MGYTINKLCIKRIFSFTGGILFLLIVSCNKQLDIDSTSIANEEGSWSTYENARSALIGVYGLTRAAIAQNDAHWMYGELRNGDFNAVSRSDLNAIITGQLNAGYTLLESVSNWRPFYAAINACNLFIERAAGCMADIRYTESYYNLDIAQVRALRAFLYFYIVRIWGDVPFTTSSGEGGGFEELSRTDQSAVLSFATTELTEIASKLPYVYSVLDEDQLFPNNYYGESSDYWLNTPFTRLAAYAVLAHIAAWQGNYLDVAVYTQFIANNYSKSSLDYTSVSNLVSSTGVFSGGTTDNYYPLISFNFDKEDGETTTDGHIENLTIAQTTVFEMSKQLPDIYVNKDTIASMFPGNDGNDDRFGYDDQYTPPLRYTTYFENYDAEVPVFKKIRVVDGGVSDGTFAVFNSSIVFTRLEELMLLRAEALAVIGDESDARTLLNTLRSNRSLDGIASSVTGNDLLEEIFQERRRELIGEGWRWYDLVRLNRLTRSDASFNTLLDNDGIYWPLAQDVLSRNTKLVQNSYWN
ncbi:MAG: RagB/SusD family nutrient uptake outer membrane protein [Niabella sp.]